jgi:hypothetical protein
VVTWRKDRKRSWHPASEDNNIRILQNFFLKAIQAI